MPGKKRSGVMEFRGGSWKVRVTENGGRRWYDTETADRATADRKRAALLARIERDEAAKRAGREAAPMPKFRAAALAWLAARQEQGIASVASDRPLLELYALPILGEQLVGDVRPGHVRDALERAKAAGLAKTTLKKLRAAISAVLHRAWQDGHAGENVALKVDAPETREVRKIRVVLSDDEIAALWASPKADLEVKLLGVVARVEGGMRTIDLIAWDWEHIDLASFAWCMVPRTKTGKPDRLEVPEPLRVPIAAWWEQHGRPSSGPVFPVTKGERRGERRRARGVSFAKRLRRNLFAAGITRLAPSEKKPHPRDPLYFETDDTLPVDFHSFRRGFAQALDGADGVSRKAAMRLTGHASEDAHLRYLKRTGRAGEVLELPAAVVPPLARAGQDPGEKDIDGVTEIAGLGVALGRASGGWDRLEQTLTDEHKSSQIVQAPGDR